MTKAIEQTSKFTKGHAKSRKKKLPVAKNYTAVLGMQLVTFCSLLLAWPFVNFDVFSIAFVMYLLNGVPFSIFVLIRDYCTPLSLDGFSNATTLLSLSFAKTIMKN